MLCPLYIIKYLYWFVSFIQIWNFWVHEESNPEAFWWKKMLSQRKNLNVIMPTCHVWGRGEGYELQIYRKFLTSPDKTYRPYSIFVQSTTKFEHSPSSTVFPQLWPFTCAVSMLKIKFYFKHSNCACMLTVLPDRTPLVDIIPDPYRVDKFTPKNEVRLRSPYMIYETSVLWYIFGMSTLNF